MRNYSPHKNFIFIRGIKEDIKMPTKVIAPKDSTNLTPVIDLLRNQQKQQAEKEKELKTTLLMLMAFTLHHQMKNSLDKFNKQTTEQHKQIIDKMKDLYKQQKQLSDSLRLNN